MGDFLEALHDNDLNVRRVALVAFNSAAHNKPSLVRDLLHSVLAHLYSETKVRVSSSIYVFVALISLHPVICHQCSHLKIILLHVCNCVLSS